MPSVAVSISEITGDLYRRLRYRCENAQGVVMLEEVGDGAGYDNRGRSDAISMQTWPSKTLAITGYEIKATRADWLRELDRPGKNRTWQDRCHEWYVVAPKGVVQLDELPVSWGLMFPSGKDKLRIASRSERPTPEGLKLPLAAAIFRAAACDRRNTEARLRAEIQERVQENQAHDYDAVREERDELNKQYRVVLKALGVSEWSPDEQTIARAKAFRGFKAADVERSARYWRDQIKRVLETIDALIPEETG